MKLNERQKEKIEEMLYSSIGVKKEDKKLVIGILILFLIGTVIFFGLVFNYNKIKAWYYASDEALIVQPVEGEFTEATDLRDAEIMNGYFGPVNFLEYENIRDNKKNSYTWGYGGQRKDGVTKQAWAIGKDYKALQGTVILDYSKRRKKNYEAVLCIYEIGSNGEKLLYKSGTVSKGCEPQFFSIDISDVSVLMITIYGDDMVRLADCRLMN